MSSSSKPKPYPTHPRTQNRIPPATMGGRGVPPIFSRSREELARSLAVCTDWTESHLGF